METTTLTALLNDLPAIITALKEIGQLGDIAIQEFEQFNSIVAMAQAGQLTNDYLNNLDAARQTSYQNTMSALVSQPSTVGA